LRDKARNAIAAEIVVLREELAATR